MTATEKIARIFNLSHLGCEDRLVEADLAELESLLLGNAAAQRTYLLLAEQDMQLAWLAKHALAVGSSSEVGAAAEPTTSRLVVLSRLWSKHPLIWSIAGCAAGFVIYFALISWGMLDRGRNVVATSGTHVENQKSEIRNQQSEAAPVATIRDSVDAQWSRSTNKLEIRNQQSEIAAGEPLSIESGLVELQLKQGVTLLIEGPAEWTIDGDNNATLKQGKLVAKVPQQAIGFTLTTPTATVVDLGTEFEVVVANNGTSRVAVLAGKVDVSAKSALATSQPVRLIAGKQVFVSDRVYPVQGAVDAPLFDSRPLSESVAGGPATRGNSPYEVLLWYRLNNPTLAADPSATFTEPLTAHGRVTFADKTVEKSDRHGLRFGADNFLQSADVAFTDFPEDNFVLEASVRAEDWPGEMGALVAYVGTTTTNGYGLYLYDGEWVVVFGGKAIIKRGVKAELNQWVHLALLRESGRSYLLVDGGQRGEVSHDIPKPADSQLLIGGLTDKPDETFTGSIRDVRLLRLNRAFNTKILLHGQHFGGNVGK